MELRHHGLYGFLKRWVLMEFYMGFKHCHVLYLGMLVSKRVRILNQNEDMFCG